MKEKLLLMVLILGMICINVSAQTKKSVNKTTAQTNVKQKKVSNVSKELIEECGFEWYKVGKNGKWGAEDKNGKVLVPIEYDGIDFQCTSGTGFGFRVNNGYEGYYTPNGKCVIPCSRHYLYINADSNSSIGTYYWGQTKEDGPDGPKFFCDANGDEICQIEGYGLAEPHYVCGKFFWTASLKTDSKNKWVLLDGNGNQKYGPYEFVSVGNSGKITYMQEGHYMYLENISAITTTNNPFAKTRNAGIRYSSTANSSSASSSNSSSSSSNAGNGTTTIHVEHHHDPVPVQQWQACIGCGGMGTMGCDFCGGSGTKYIGDRLHRCSRCNGRGIIPCNVCYGNKGQYITVYK